MTDSVRFNVALCLSLFLHFICLQAGWTGESPRMGKGERISHEMTSTAPLFGEVASIALEDFVENTSAGNGADQRQRERNLYLEAVSDEIHARRFILSEANRTVIGLAYISFAIAPDGSFHNISLSETSGNALLDRMAEAAVHDASAKVRPPASMGQEEIHVTIAVKYQYGL